MVDEANGPLCGRRCLKTCVWWTKPQDHCVLDEVRREDQCVVDEAVRPLCDG